ncbi:TetR/AcrR family transcriptional regulator [Amycolatopsis suaedae]|uniref:TetR/AcrR family transcriptional regulator n=1 Tax=Amycolatopsis suaedae TaxID=2510978 RepID=A0A4Q7J7Q2_9PSEU|nr:TetR/AcrR family transcriptional regulator [Amycolatopsis suaedae]RZQ62958.1 TetR/AcrR family transcriptional regulator [Amycolatopsis suaedae]
MDDTTATTQVLDAAEELFYSRGIQAVGMDDIRTRSQVSLKRLYRLFASKDDLVAAYLDQRDTRWIGRLEAHVAAVREPKARILAVFDWLAEWFSEPDFQGCAFINSFGELGRISPRVAAVARGHKRRFRVFVTGLTEAAGLPAETADQLVLLAEGAMVVAGMDPGPAPAHQARRAAEILIAAH